MNITLEALGISKEDLIDRVVERVASMLLETAGMDEDGDEVTISSPMARRLEKSIKELIDQRVAHIAEQHVLPKVSAMVDNLVLQKTNTWGENIGTPVSFIEYMVGRAERYISEQVDSDGVSKEENRNSYWNGKQSRITFLVHKHLQYEIGTAVKEAMQAGTGALAKAIHETVRIKLNETAAALKVEVKA